MARFFFLAFVFLPFFSYAQRSFVLNTHIPACTGSYSSVQAISSCIISSNNSLNGQHVATNTSDGCKGYIVIDWFEKDGRPNSQGARYNFSCTGKIFCEKKNLPFQRLFFKGEEVPSTICDNGCTVNITPNPTNVTLCLKDGCLSEVSREYTGETCQSSDGSTPTTPEKKCLKAKDGKEYCQGDKIPNGCVASFNTGKMICTQDIPPNCVTNKDGKKICYGDEQPNKNCVFDATGKMVCEQTKDKQCPAGQIADGNGNCVAPNKTDPNTGCPAGQVKDTNGNCSPDNNKDNIADNDQSGAGKDGKGECPHGTQKDANGQCVAGDGKQHCPVGQKRKGDSCVPCTQSEIIAGQCGQSSGVKGGDDCETPLTCSGDALQCYIAKKQHQQHCLQKKQHDEVFVELSKVGQDFEKKAQGTADGVLEALTPKSSTDLPTQINTDGLGWNRQCPQTLSIDLAIMGVIQVKQDLWCKFLTIAGKILVAFNLIGAVFYILR